MAAMERTAIDLSDVVWTESTTAGYFTLSGGAGRWTTIKPTGNTTVLGEVSKSGNVYTFKAASSSGALNVTNVGKDSAVAAEWKVILGGEDDFVAFAEGASRSTVDAGAGNDTINLANAAEGSSLKGGAGNDVFRVLDSNAVKTGLIIDAGDGNDEIAAVKASTIKGGAGNDAIVSGGTNVIDAGAGNDTITVAGGDTLTAGNGSDVIVLQEAEGSATVTDYRYSENDVIRTSGYGAVFESIADTPANAKNYFKADGSVSDGTFTLSPSSTSAYYQVLVGANGSTATQDVWYAGSSGTTINASGQTKAIFMIGNNNDDVADYLVGGAGKDTILAGSGDSVNGGAGNDSIVLTGAKNVYVGVSSTSGKDAVTGFTGGWTEGESDVVYLFDGFTANTKVEANGTGTTISGGSAAVVLSDVKTDDTTKIAKFYATDSSNTLKKVAVVAAGSTGTLTSDDSLADYYIGDHSALDASNYDSSLKVDLGNTGKYGSTANFSGITMVTGSANNDNVLVGAAGAKNTLVGGTGGSNSLWGGGASNDYLQGGSGAADTFYYGSANGNDTINGYTADEDVLYIFSGGATGTSNDGSNTTIKFADGKLVLEGFSDANANISYTTDGASTHVARIGKSDQTNEFTYDSSVTYYYGGTKGDTLKVSGSNDAKVWLNGNDTLGQYYTGITILDGTEASGNVELAGSTKADSVKGGTGSSSIWGGSGAVNDTLEGGSGSNTFYFGLGEGKDVITSSNDDDKVMLYNVNEAQVSAAAVDSSGNMVISLTDGSALTIRNYTSQGATNFGLADASYTYNKETNTWTKG